jgi:tRNA G18 (ribose-2'-O)-methylase SpoU
VYHHRNNRGDFLRLLVSKTTFLSFLVGDDVLQKRRARESMRPLLLSRASGALKTTKMFSSSLSSTTTSSGFVPLTTTRRRRRRRKSAALVLPAVGFFREFYGGENFSSGVGCFSRSSSSSSRDDQTEEGDDEEKTTTMPTLSAKAIRRGFNDKTLSRTFDKNYVYHGRKRVYQKGEEDEEENDDETTTRRAKKIFPFTSKNALNFEGLQAEIEEIEEIVVGNNMIGADRIRRIEETVSKRVFSLLPILEKTYDTGNFLAVCRSAEALGIGAVGVVAEKGLVFKQSGRTSGGAVKWQHISQYESTEEMVKKVKNRGFRILVTDFDNEKAKAVGEYDWTIPTAVVFGNELDGVSETAKKLADGKVYLPMSGFTESFNLSVSAALLLYHATEDRKRRILSSSSSSEDMSEEEKGLLRAIWLSRSVANYSRPKYMKGLVERLRLRKKKGEGKTNVTIVHDDYDDRKSSDRDGDADEEEHEDIVAFQEILQPSQLLKRGKFLD